MGHAHHNGRRGRAIPGEHDARPEGQGSRNPSDERIVLPCQTPPAAPERGNSKRYARADGRKFPRKWPRSASATQRRWKSTSVFDAWWVAGVTCLPGIRESLARGRLRRCSRSAGSRGLSATRRALPITYAVPAKSSISTSFRLSPIAMTSAASSRAVSTQARERRPFRAAGAVDVDEREIARGSIR